MMIGSFAKNRCIASFWEINDNGVARPMREVVFQQLCPHASCIHSYDGRGARIKVLSSVECHSNCHFLKGFVWRGEGVFDDESQKSSHPFRIGERRTGDNLVKLLRDPDFWRRGHKGNDSLL